MKELRNSLLLFFLVALVFLIFQYMKPKAGDMPLQRPMDAAELPDGRIIVTDGGGYLWNDSGSKVIVIDRKNKLYWSYRGSLRNTHGLAVLRNGNYLIADTGSDRVLQVDRSKNHVWISDKWGRSWGKLSDGSHLDLPVSARELDNGRLLISDSGNGRVIETDRSSKGPIFWKYTGLTRQSVAEPISNGNVLVCDQSANRVIEIDRGGAVVWQFSKGLKNPMNAGILPGGTILIADTGNNRIVEINREGKIVRETVGMLNRPNRAIELKNGNWLVCDSGHARLLELDVSNAVVWEFRNIRTTPLRDELTNGGAELLVSKKPSGWITCDLLAHNDGVWFVDNKTAAEGSNSLSIRASQTPDGMMFWGQLVKAVPGSRLEWTASVRTFLATGVTGIGLYFMDDLNGKIGETNVDLKGLTNEWTPLRLSAKVPEQAAEVFAVLVMDGTGQSWFDGMRLSVVNP